MRRDVSCYISDMLYFRIYLLVDMTIKSEYQIIFANTKHAS